MNPLVCGITICLVDVHRDAAGSLAAEHARFTLIAFQQAFFGRDVLGDLLALTVFVDDEGYPNKNETKK